MTPRVAIVVPSWNTRELLDCCLRSVTDTCGDLAIEITVVDNGSSDGSVDMVRERFPQVQMICNSDNAGFARACNQGIAATTAPYVLLLNSDARLLDGTLRALVALADAQPRSAVIGGLIRNGDGSFQASFSDFPNLIQELLMATGLGRLLFGPWYPSHDADEAAGPRRVAWISGAAMLVRRSASADVGGFDERYFMYAEEMDLCWRFLHAGWDVWYDPAAVIVHLGGASSRKQPVQREINLYSGRVQFCRRHRGVWNARAMAALILACAAVKRPIHSVWRGISAGRYGRTVPPATAIWAELRRHL